jgi:hypothetical protein
VSLGSNKYCPKPSAISFPRLAYKGKGKHFKKLTSMKNNLLKSGVVQSGLGPSAAIKQFAGLLCIFMPEIQA